MYAQEIDFQSRGYSSVVRALPLHGKGRRFETGYSYKINCISFLLSAAHRQCDCCCDGFNQFVLRPCIQFISHLFVPVCMPKTMDAHASLCYPASSLLTTCMQRRACYSVSCSLPLLHSQVGKAADVLDAVPLRINMQLAAPEHDNLVLPLRCCCFQLPRRHRLEPNLHVRFTVQTIEGGKQASSARLLLEHEHSEQASQTVL